MRATWMLGLSIGWMACGEGRVDLEPEDVITPLESGDTRRVCTMLRRTDTQLTLLEVDVETGLQTVAPVGFDVEAITDGDTLQTSGIARVGDDWVASFFVGDEYRWARMNASTGEVETQVRSSIGFELGGTDEILTSCSLSGDVCVYAAYPGEDDGPSDRISGPEGELIQSSGDRIYTMDRNENRVDVWERSGTFVETVELEGLSSFIEGFSVVGDRIAVLQWGLFAEPVESSDQLVLFDLTGAHVETRSLLRPGDAAGVGFMGLHCSDVAEP